MYRNTLKYGAHTGCTCIKICAPGSQIVHTGSRVHWVYTLQADVGFFIISWFSRGFILNMKPHEKHDLEKQQTSECI